MTKEEKLTLLKARYNKLSGSIKNIKCPGVMRKLKRQINKAESN